MNRLAIKQNARDALGKSYFSSDWLMGIVLMLIYGFLTGIAGSTVIGAILVMGPLAYGLQKAFLNKLRTGAPFEIGSLFDGFKDDFGGLFLLGIISTLVITLFSFLFIIPGIIMALRYSMIYFIKIDHPDYDWKLCMDESKRIMQGHVGELLVLYLSFIGFYLVGFLCLGVGTFWAAPYMIMASADFYCRLTFVPALDTQQNFQGTGFNPQY